MGSLKPGNVRLPSSIYEQLGLRKDASTHPRKTDVLGRLQRRKENRKAVRVDGNVRGGPARQAQSSNKGDEGDIRDLKQRSARNRSSGTGDQASSSLRLTPPAPSPRVSVKPTQRRVHNTEASKSDEGWASTGLKKQLAQDDADILALEKVLGVSGKRNYSQAFEEDGLGYLLTDLPEHGRSEQPISSNRSKISAVRESAVSHQNGPYDSPIDEKSPGSDDSEFVGFSSASSSDVESLGSQDIQILPENKSHNQGDDQVRRYRNSHALEQRARENPYRPPVTEDTLQVNATYIPPSLRNAGSENASDMARLQRQVKGQYNRLSESNLPSIVSNIENLSRSHSRHHVFDVLIDLLIASVLDRSALQDTFVILLAGFVAALSKTYGVEFAAQMITRLDIEFERLRDDKHTSEAGGKECLNLASMISQLYVFQLVGCRLVYDYIRICLRDLSETNTEILLRIIRVAGQQLRQDDPSALKDIVNDLDKQLERIGSSSLSTRTKFMVETITSLKNGKAKHGAAAASITSEHTNAMKKTLGMINQRNPRMTEPLRVDLQDIRSYGRQGKWNLISASRPHGGQQHVDHIHDSEESPQAPNDQEEFFLEHTDKLANLARQCGMNTDVRRSIFVAIMSASDYEDAELRLTRLRLTRRQSLETPKVLLRCAASEANHNPYYTLIAKRISTDHRSKMAFKYSLWDLFRQMGERLDEDKVVDDEALEASLQARSVVNVARMYGALIANGNQDLGILKILNLTYLQEKTQLFVEILLLTVILGSQSSSKEQRNEKSLIGVFLRSRDIPEMASSLQYFLRKTLSKSDVLDNEYERRTVRWACRVLCDTLSAIASNGS